MVLGSHRLYQLNRITSEMEKVMNAEKIKAIAQIVGAIATAVIFILDATG